MKFNKKQFIEFFVKKKGISFFDKSAISKRTGKPSTVYFNWRTISEDVHNIDKCADYVIKFAQDKKINPDCFLGVPEGATKLALIVQYKWAKEYKKSPVLALVRGKPKIHGAQKDRDFLGIPKGRVVVIEDVIVRGGATIDTLKKLKKVKIVPYAIIVLSDRMDDEYKSKLLKILNREKIKFYSLTTQKEVVEEAVRILKPSKEIIDKLREFGKID